MRTILLAIVVALALAAPAQASYLHMAKVRPAATGYVAWMTDVFGGTDGELGHCWHQGPHVVQCSWTLRGIAVCDKDQSDTCDIDLAGEPGESHSFVVIAQRRYGLVAHTLGIGQHPLLID